MKPLMVLIISSLKDYFLGNHWDILLVNYLDLMKVSKRFFDDKFLETALGNVDEIIFVIDVGTVLGSLDGSFDGYNGGHYDIFRIGDSKRSTDGKVIGYDENINVRLSISKVLVTILGNVDGITLDIDVGTELGSLY